MDRNVASFMQMKRYEILFFLHHNIGTVRSVSKMKNINDRFIVLLFADLLFLSIKKRMETENSNET